MFQFARFPPIFEDMGDRGLTLPDCSIRRSAGQWSFAPLRSFSQLVASFIGRYRQGIHRMLLLS